ncbi:immunoglobulin-like domain-containing protein [Corallincola platygyrae]|uniref:Immunoglobulin-like domain-containing protein n=1 Tax=Corallincola platygyrae TaxID=1193278 RepID=A0ABW4XK25_9GAMM
MLTIRATASYLSTRKLTSYLLLMSAVLTACSDSDSDDDLPTPPEPAPETEADAPTLSLIGEKAVQVSLGEMYIEQGAFADDTEDGDISEQIVIRHQLDTSTPGDYLVRYSVTDSDQNSATEIARLVRVVDEQPIQQSLRPRGTTASPLGYVEQLPNDYAQNGEQPFALLIFNHGGGSNENFAGSNGLRFVTDAGGPPQLGKGGDWDSDLPLIVLSPQRRNSGNINTPTLKRFVEYAKATYKVDPDKIYMSGWSQGGWTSLQFAVDYPGELAAVASMAGGFYRGIPTDVCNLANTPIWVFHGNADSVVNVSNSQNTVAAINACNPQVRPLMTIYSGQGHFVHHPTFSLAFLNQGVAEYDIYDRSIYEWLLEQSLTE